MNRKIVFPTNEPNGLLSKRGAHFGRANFYTVVEIDASNTVCDVMIYQNPGHSESGCGGAVSNIRALGVETLVVSGIGASPLKGFIQNGINVFYDNASASVNESVKAFLSEKLPLMTPENSCNHH